MPIERESRTKADFDEAFVIAYLPALKKRWDAALAACQTEDDSYLDDGSLSSLWLTFSWHTETIRDGYRLDISLGEPFAEAEVYDLNEDTSEAVGGNYAECEHGLWWASDRSPAVCECEDYCAEHDRVSCEFCFPEKFPADEE